VTDPLPVPIPPEVIVSHEGLLLVAVQVQPADVDTAIGVPLPPAAPIDCLSGAIMNVHGVDAPSCVTVKVRPAMVSVPVRAAPVFAVTVKPTDPLPVPVSPEVIVSHEGLLLVAVQVQPADVDTAMGVPVPPAAPIDCLSGAIMDVHGVDAPSCATVKACPAIVSVPVRAAPVFAATVKPTDPLPVPVSPEVIVSHDALLVAVHPQLAVVETVTLPVDVPASTERVTGAIANVHPAAS